MTTELRGRERPVTVHVRIDLEDEATVPRDDHVAVVHDPAYEPAVADCEPGRCISDGDKLDPGAHANAGPDTSG